jgi:hypothetical protein
MSTLRDLPRSTPGRRRDPLGKQALFAGGTAQEPAASTPSAPSAPAAGGRGPVVVECSRCHAETPVSYLTFALSHVPVGVWLPIPGRRFNRYARCPSCHRLGWLRARWSLLGS